MSQLSKAILLINLLSHRSSVSVKSIQQACGLSRRSVFRYLRALSEANLPVIFDRKSGGYRMLEQTKFPTNLTYSDIMLLHCLLRLVKRHTNREYASQIDELNEKVCAHQPLDLNAGPENDPIRSEEALPDLSASLTIDLLKLAAEHQIPVSVVTCGDANSEQSILLSDVRLAFDQMWILKGRFADQELQFVLERILAAQLDSNPKVRR